MERNNEQELFELLKRELYTPVLDDMDSVLVVPCSVEREVIEQAL